MALNCRRFYRQTVVPTYTSLQATFRLHLLYAFVWRHNTQHNGLSCDIQHKLHSAKQHWVQLCCVARFLYCYAECRDALCITHFSWICNQVFAAGKYSHSILMLYIERPTVSLSRESWLNWNWSIRLTSFCLGETNRLLPIHYFTALN